MAFTYTNSRGTTYVLHARETTLKNGLARTLFFFAKEAKEGALDHVPPGYMVAETKNGLPVLKRGAGTPVAAGEAPAPQSVDETDSPVEEEPEA